MEREGGGAVPTRVGPAGPDLPLPLQPCQHLKPRSHAHPHVACGARARLARPQPAHRLFHLARAVLRVLEDRGGGHLPAAGAGPLWPSIVYGPPHPH